RTQLLVTAMSAALSTLAISQLFAADSTDRTSMPDFCSRRDVNCVLPDGGVPRVVAGPGTVTQPPISTTVTTPATAGLTMPGSPGGTTTVVIQSTSPTGGTTVITPAV